MLNRLNKFRWLCVCSFAIASSVILASIPAEANENGRETPLVRAVASSKAAVVNLRGRKTVRPDSGEQSLSQPLKQVNGMGTGVVIDSRGYVLTNYHVVQGVSKIHVTTADREKTTARLLAHDPETDLAILKIDLDHPLPVINIGTSSDLMLAETVAAVGNAYGYEHTVTVGIISQLGRTVQVNDKQVYRNLIQTDAPINPGNSGGPLLNLNGQMIGINVAVRIGAQGIAFAIPSNDAMDVAAKLMRQMNGTELNHGLITKTNYIQDRPVLMVDSVVAGSPAHKIGLTKGDRITAINGTAATHELDFHRALLGMKTASKIAMSVIHGESQRDVQLGVEVDSANRPPVSNIAWTPLGVQLTPASDGEMKGRHPKYSKGLKVVRVRPDSPAEAEGIIEGDILVAMHGWKTESIDNLSYVLELPDLKEDAGFRFYILRDKEPFWGEMRIASRPSQ